LHRIFSFIKKISPGETGYKEKKWQTKPMTRVKRGNEDPKGAGDDKGTQKNILLGNINNRERGGRSVG
jgi:hypothetical protein